ncbi:MAG: hypothetical protein IPI48_18855 [bacterium]|nr:hypothetical protein [bacterium]
METFDKVLVSIGRRPTPDLGLENTATKLDGRKFVVVDGQRRTLTATSSPSATSPARAACWPHKAYAEATGGRRVGRRPRKADLRPARDSAVVFTDPEIAWCGLTETEARAQGIKVKTAKLPWRGNGRTLTLGREDGMTKLIVDPETHACWATRVAGPGAGGLIAEGVLRDGDGGGQ